MRIFFQLILPIALILTTMGAAIPAYSADLETAVFYVA